MPGSWEGSTNPNPTGTPTSQGSRTLRWLRALEGSPDLGILLDCVPFPLPGLVLSPRPEQSSPSSPESPPRRQGRLLHPWRLPDVVWSQGHLQSTVTLSQSSHLAPPQLSLFLFPCRDRLQGERAERAPASLTRRLLLRGATAVSPVMDICPPSHSPEGPTLFVTAFMQVLGQLQGMSRATVTTLRMEM